MKSDSYSHIKKWRYKVKNYAVQAFGGSCGICSYNKCLASLTFHHLNPSEKEFSISSMKINHWGKIAKELGKCVCLCRNCHGEVESGITTIPGDIRRFDEKYKFYKVRGKQYDTCPLCGQKKDIRRKYCSQSCAAVAQRKIDWEIIDLKGMIDRGMPIIVIARNIGVSNSAVTKRLKYLNIPYNIHSRKIIREKRAFRPHLIKIGHNPFKGISFYKSKNKWRVFLSTGEGKQVHLGYYSDPQEAARVYDINALKILGETAITNKKLGLLGGDCRPVVRALL